MLGLPWLWEHPPAPWELVGSRLLVGHRALPNAQRAAGFSRGRGREGEGEGEHEAMPEVSTAPGCDVSPRVGLSAALGSELFVGWPARGARGSPWPGFCKARETPTTSHDGCSLPVLGFSISEARSWHGAVSSCHPCGTPREEAVGQVREQHPEQRC